MNPSKPLAEMEIGVHIGDMKKIIDENREVGGYWTTSILCAGDVKSAVQECEKEILEILEFHGVDSKIKEVFKKHFGFEKEKGK